MRREQRHEALAAHRAAHRQSHRQRRRAETQEEILTAAREVFAESGAVDFSLSEIARRLGFTPAALYKYFASKEDLLRALAERSMHSLSEAMLAAPASLPPDERAVEIGMAYLDFGRRNPQDIALVGLHESLHLDYEGGHQAFGEAGMAVFREGVEQGIFTASSDDDVWLMAYGAWSLVHGMAVLLGHQPSEMVKQTERARQRQLLQAFINGLKSDWLS
jgi:AcrR family transcriptional regulator